MLRHFTSVWSSKHNFLKLWTFQLGNSRVRARSDRWVCSPCSVSFNWKSLFWGPLPWHSSTFECGATAQQVTRIWRAQLPPGPGALGWPPCPRDQLKTNGQLQTLHGQVLTQVGSLLVTFLSSQSAPYNTLFLLADVGSRTAEVTSLLGGSASSSLKWRINAVRKLQTMGTIMCSLNKGPLLSANGVLWVNFWLVLGSALLNNCFAEIPHLLVIFSSVSFSNYTSFICSL